MMKLTKDNKLLHLDGAQCLREVVYVCLMTSEFYQLCNGVLSIIETGIKTR